jgi:capsular exopolysaccharide synthesis family protein
MSLLINEKSLITDINPKSPISEAYRALRTNIDFSAIDEQLKVIMITSAGPGEGKSTTAANLAVTFAQADKKVLIIDADLRKPTLHHIFERTNRWGLTNIIAGRSGIKEVISDTNINNLDLITSGPIPPNPSELLASKRMSAVLQELKAIYDVIIIDTPPALAVTDAQVVATQCEGVLLVIDSGKVKRQDAIKAKACLEHVKARIIGAVLNNIDRKKGDSYYYYYYGNKES